MMTFGALRHLYQHPSPAIPPTASRSSLPTFSSSGLSISSRPSGSSPHDSSTPLLDSVMPYSSFGSPFTDISTDSINQVPLSPFTDISTDSINRVPLSPSKRKMLSERLSALPTPSHPQNSTNPIQSESKSITRTYPPQTNSTKFLIFSGT
jgi:hypothetical protein